MHVCKYVCICFVFMYVCMYVFICLFMCACLRVCMHASVHYIVYEQHNVYKMSILKGDSIGTVTADCHATLQPSLCRYYVNLSWHA